MDIQKIWFSFNLRHLHRGWIFACAFLMSGCVTVIQPPSLQNPEEKIITKELSQESWAQVLTQSVDSRGRVAFKDIAGNPTFLHQVVLFISQTSPENHPGEFTSPEDQLAYYINSYNALAMYGIIYSNFPSDFNGFTDRAKFFAFTEFTIGGEKISLYDYENDVIRPLGDPRIHFALNCMVKACPRLPQTPFRAEDLDSTLNILAREFVNDPRHVQVVEASHKVRLSEILSFYKEDFVNPKAAVSLIAYINRYRDSPIDETFELEFIPYDWTVNYQ